MNSNDPQLPKLSAASKGRSRILLYIGKVQWFRVKLINKPAQPEDGNYFAVAVLAICVAH